MNVTSRMAAALVLTAGGVAPGIAADPPAPRGYDPAVFRGGPARTGDLGPGRLPKRGEVLWRVDIDGGVGNAVVADGVVYLAGGEGSLFAIRADASAILWQDDQPGRRFSAAPAVVGDRIFIATDQGLSAHSRDNGKALWDYRIAGGAGESSPLPVGGRIIVAGYDGMIHAVDAATGEQAWTHDIATDAPPAPPGFDQKRAVIGDNKARPMTAASDGTTVFLPIFDQSRVVAVDAATGQRRWSFAAKGWTHAEPTVAGDDVFVTSQDKNLYCLEKATGRPRWSFATRWRCESGVAVRDGAAYFGSCDGFFYRVDAKTGQAAWSFETPKGPDGKHSPIYSSPLVSADSVCFGSFDGHFYMLDTATGDLRWKVRPVEGSEVCSSPCADGRFVFVGVRADSFKKTGTHAIVAIGENPKK